jgi:hypothetical protein
MNVMAVQSESQRDEHRRHERVLAGLMLSLERRCIICSKNLPNLSDEVMGREVRTLVNGRKVRGSYEVRIDADGLPSGVYFYRIQAAGFVQTKRLLLLR